MSDMGKIKLFDGKFSDQTKLIYSISEIRRLLNAPTKLTGAELKSCRKLAERFGDAVQFNAGWHMAAPEKKLPGAASTEKLFADVQIITDYLQINAKPPKRAKGGRPKGSVKAMDDRYVCVIADYFRSPKKKLLDCVRDAARKKLIDDKIADKTHVMRLERYFARVRAANAAPEPPIGGNVLRFSKRTTSTKTRK